MKKIAIVLGILVLFFGISRAEDLSRVTAEGKAAIIKGDTEGAKKAALDDAKRNAVEQVGSEVVSETVVENFELVKDRVVSKAVGYVHDVKVVEEGPKDGNYAVKIEATVSKKEIKDDATMIYNEMAKPRMMVLVAETVGGQAITSSAAENTIIEFLMEKGFSLVDQATAKENIKKDELRLAAEGDTKAAAKIGLRSGAEVIIVGTAQQPSRAESIKDILYTSKATVSVKAVKTDNAQIYASATVTEPGVDATPESAVQKAVRVTTNKAGKDIFWKILKAWNEEKLHGAQIELILTGVKNLTALKGLKAEIGKIKGVTEIIQRDFDRPTATLTVTFQGDTNRLADLLEEILEVTSITPGKLQATVK